MPEPKAQLIDPQGPIDVPGISATGIVTATGGFVGAVQGAATGLANTTTNLTVGVVTSTGFVGDVTGTASSVTKGTNLSLGIVTATSFAGDLTGNAAGLSTTTSGLKLGIVTATSFAGNFTGIGSGLTGTPHIQAGIMTATSFAGNFTGLASGLTGTPNIMVGVLTGTSYSGDGSALTGIAATNWITNNVTANSGTTAIDLSNGNTIKFTQTANTTVSFANTGTSNILTFIRANGSGTITWPSSVKWNNGAEPTLTSNPRSSEAQQFMFLTRDEGVTWYGWENFNIDPSDTKFFAWGNDSYQGALPIPMTTRSRVSSPVQVPGSTWSFVADSGESVIYPGYAIRSDGTLWTWCVGQEGGTQFGLLGNNSSANTQYSSPIQIGTGSNWSYITAGSAHVIASKTDGTMWAWGRNYNGALGLNQSSPVNVSSPTQIPGTTWKIGEGGITAGGNQFGGAIKTDGTLWVWGYNGDGILGQNQSQPTKRSSPVQVPGTTWSQISANGGQCVAAIKTDGTLWSWGNNGSGSSAQNNVIKYSSPVQVGSDTTWDSCSGGTSVIATKTDGTLWTWGSNTTGQLGLSNKTAYSSPAQVPGTTWKQGLTANCVSDYQGAAVRTDGTLWSWGSNEAGQLGHNNNTNYSSPKQIPGTSWYQVGISNGFKGLLGLQYSG
jgi:hypothetical protein